ncbi:hypothetical protein ACTHR0_18285, partial [Bacillus safensis]|uniref:hypothetical protein n=1 Tax=Bacillus safensis TaxID=561879 RepID=UPI003F7CAC4E
LVMPFLNLPFVRGVPDSVLPLCPWHLLVLLHQVSCPEEFTPSYSLTRSILPIKILSLNRNIDTKNSTYYVNEQGFNRIL